MRKMLKLPYRIHNYLISGIVKSITSKLDRIVARFAHRYALFSCESSVFEENRRYLMDKYNFKNACKLKDQ